MPRIFHWSHETRDAAGSRCTLTERFSKENILYDRHCRYHHEILLLRFGSDNISQFLSNILQHFSWIAVVLGRYFQNIQNQASRFFSAQDLEYRDLLKSLQDIVYHIAASVIGHEFALVNAFGLMGSIFCGGDPGAGQL